jgi:glutamate-1-semialdehyde 2,1-aminomutase
VTPDLTCFGKVIGGGLPIGAVGGRRDVMETLSPLGKVFHAGTLAGNPMATAAGLAALSELTPDAYAEIERRASRLASILETSLGDRVTVTRVGTLVGIHLGSALTGRAPTNFTEAKTTDEAGYARFFHAALTNGVAMAPGAYEAMFVGLGHDDVVLDELERRLVAAAESVATGSTAS